MLIPRTFSLIWEAHTHGHTRTHARARAHTRTHAQTHVHTHTHILPLSLIPLLSRRPRLKQRQNARKKRRRHSKKPLLKQRWDDWTLRVCMQVCICIYVCASMYMYIYMCIYIYVQMYVYTYTYTYIHTIYIHIHICIYILLGGCSLLQCVHSACCGVMHVRNIYVGVMCPVFSSASARVNACARTRPTRSIPPRKSFWWKPVFCIGVGHVCACLYTHTHTHTRTHKHTHALTLSLIPLLSRRPRLKQRQNARKKRRRHSKKPLLKQRSQHHIPALLNP